MSSIGVFIPTFQGEKVLSDCLLPLTISPLKPKILVIDSSSTDQSAAIAKHFGVEVIVSPKNAFNHGLTREKGRKLLQTDIVVMMTQDAYLKDPNMLERLIAPLIRGEASISYARQLPHKNADHFASFSRSFNYPAESHIRSITDSSFYGVYTFFCSNSCAAYKNSALDEVGGFPEISFGEDSIVVARLLQKGHKIAYVAEAEVYHSHNYSLKEEFARHFEMGKERQKFSDLFICEHSTNQRGKQYARTLISHLLKNEPIKVPYGIFHLLAKWIGYHMGFYFKNSHSR